MLRLSNKTAQRVRTYATEGNRCATRCSKTASNVLGWLSKKCAQLSQEMHVDTAKGEKGQHTQSCMVHTRMRSRGR